VPSTVMRSAVSRIGAGLPWLIFLTSPSTGIAANDRIRGDLALFGLWDTEQQHRGDVRGLWLFTLAVTKCIPEGAGGESRAVGSDA